MRTFFKIQIITLLLCITPLLDAQIIIVTNKSSDFDVISKEMIQYIYLAKTTKTQGIKVEPLLSKDETLHRNFCTTILCKSVPEYNSYWTRLLFSGQKSITKKLDYKEIVDKLKKPNTIAYIEKKDLKKEWKIVYESN